MGVGKREVPVSPWPWRGSVAAVAFAVVNALSAFVLALTAALAGSDRFGNAAMVCAVSAFVTVIGLCAVYDSLNGAPRRGLPREERVRLARARARARVDEEIRRLEREVEL